MCVPSSHQLEKEAEYRKGHRIGESVGYRKGLEQAIEIYKVFESVAKATFYHRYGTTKFVEALKQESEK